MLTIHQINHFRHSGYLVLPTRLERETVDEVKAAVAKDMEAAVEPVVRGKSGEVARLSAVLDRDQIFLDTARSEAVVGPLRSLLGENIEILKNRHNHVTVNARSSADDFHRDNLQWSRGLLTVIFYLEDSTVARGCTELVPGTHLLPGVSHHHRLSEADWIVESGLLSQSVRIEAQAGQMLAIDSTLFHRIGENRTDETRMSMTIGYQSVDEFIDQENPKRILVSGERIYGGNDRRK